jgi:Limiting CO2-inducible proteins B/C beta carbonyic anhydrases
MKKRDKLELVRKHYPNALTTLDTVNKLFDLVETHYNLDPFQIMAADSICSDDVNSIEYPARAQEMLGPFKMGGLNGFPFTGLTGMGAFAHHVPEDGAVFIYYAPHIGISKDGIPGEINRIGQSKPSACCGAAKAALGKLQKDQIKEGVITDLDYQMNSIEQIFYKQKKRILASHHPLMEATEVMYEAIHERINILAQKTDYPCRYLILMGAILINGDHDMGSFSATKRLDVVDLETKQSKSLLEFL